MSQARHTIEQLIDQSIVPIKHADAAFTQLEVYPNRHTWLDFFDKASLLVGTTALVSSLIFFIAYNWLYIGKMSKFALVESALVITIALYVALSFRRRFTLIRQLLLLIASMITGSLLALFGQVYQTGADTWQLFFGWALLIIPWVVIARFPALWLLWLGLINAFLILYLTLADLSFVSAYQDVLRVAILATINFIAFILWLISTEKKQFSIGTIDKPSNSSWHWSTYIVGLLSTYFATHLAIVTVFDDSNALAMLLSLLLWIGWCVFIYWRFYRRQVDVLMLTYLCFSVITVIMFWMSQRLLAYAWEASGLLLLALSLIVMSSAAVVWLRKAANLERVDDQNHTMEQGAPAARINNTQQQTLIALQQTGLIDTDANFDRVTPSIDTPWYLQLFFGFSGMLASLLFVGFLTLILEQTGTLDSSVALFITSAILSAAGWFMFSKKHIHQSSFWNTLAFTISAAGQLYAAFALFSSEMNTPLDTWLWLLFQVLMTVIMPNIVYRLVSTIIALGCAVYLFSYYQIPEIILGFLVLIMTLANVQRYGIIQRLPASWRSSALDLGQALTYASAGLLAIFSVYVVKAESSRDFVSYVFIYNYLFSQALLVLTSLYATYLILQRYNVLLFSKTSFIVICAVVILGVISLYAAGFLAISLIIIIATANSQRVLLGFGVFAFVSYVFWYYYQLDTSLLIKSASMLIIGTSLLLIRWLLIKRYFADSLSNNPAATSHQERLL
ncbi:DUF4401 domain-containing protein [uncultured Psychrobacter sp.]|uniref:DUF4401 domain-containing protein n=1 Tax=uncultured Psychrobacter sp. TaxID=259303 RepID=UPI00345A64A4